MEAFIMFFVLALLLIPYKIETQLILKAPQHEVMAVLKKFEDYSDWNPFIIAIKGNLKENTCLNVKLKMDQKIMNISPKVIIIQDNMFCWRGVLGVRYVFDGMHCFKAEEMPKNGTLFTHTEHFQGLLVWLMFPMLLKTKKHFELMNEALRQEVEEKIKGEEDGY
ncbi:MAG TPA: SRPBCC domain-containing protein [Epsilonproteobacteria bacterium]|nr:SRPBCC domain-containing protein [Campylobacterota bacterium]